MKEQIHERIKRLRKENNLSVEDIIQKLNVSRATYYRYENKEVEKLPLSILEPLAKILNTTPAYLMGWPEPHQEQKAEFSPRVECDIQKRLQSILDDMNSNAGLAFYNGDEEMDEETKELLKISLETSIRTAKKLAQEKFTPKKYKNEQSE